MNGIASSPPLLLSHQDEDNKTQLQDIIAADAERESHTPTPANSDITDMPTTPRSDLDAESEAANGAAKTVMEAPEEIEDEMVVVEPSDEIQKFDWEELEHRYHQMIKERTTAEDQLANEFTQLLNVRDHIALRWTYYAHTCLVLRYMVRYSQIL